MSMVKTYSRAAAAALTACLLLSSCSSATETQVDSVSPDGLVQKDIATWALPGDPYLGVDSHLRASAEQVKISQCMTAAGYEFKPAIFDWNEPKSPVTNGVGRRIFDEKIAQQYGYHTGPTSLFVKKLRSQSDWFASQTSAWESQWDICSQQVLTSEPFSTRDSSGITFNSSATSDEVDKAVVKWRECMAPLGVADLSESPEAMPSPSLAQAYGLSNDNPEGTDGVAANADEIKTAVQDARCQESSGYRQAKYESEWKADWELVKNNKDALEVKRQQIQVDTETMKRIIIDYTKANA